MEFWGVEVKAGEPLVVEPTEGMVIHLSQACIGDTKKGSDNALVHVKVGDAKKLVLGVLSSEKFPQLSFDLVFEKKFELSHNLKNGSIHFCGYQTVMGDDLDDEGEFGIEETDSEEEPELIPEPAVPNGKGQPKEVAKANAAKPGPSEKAKAKVEQPTGDEDESDDDEDDSSDDGLGSEEDSDDAAMIEGESDDDDDDDSDEESDEDTPTPKKPVSGKKRANDSASKTPVPAKKPKANAPSSEGKKVGGHTATPHPAKKVAKTPATPATADKSKSQTPKSSGVSCKSCSKTFGSDKALDSHTKAKHA